MRTKLIISLVILASFILSGCSIFGGGETPEDKSPENGEAIGVSDEKLPTSGDLMIEEDKKKDDSMMEEDTEDKKKDEPPVDEPTEEPPVVQLPPEEEPPSDDTVPDDSKEVKASPVGSWSRTALYVGNDLMDSEIAKLTIKDDGTFSSVTPGRCSGSGTVNIDTVNSIYTLNMTSTDCPAEGLLGSYTYNYKIFEFEGTDIKEMTTTFGTIREEYAFIE